MKIARSRAKVHLQKKKEAAKGLNWWFVALGFAVLAVLFVALWSVEPADMHIEELRRKGAIFYTGPRKPNLQSVGAAVFRAIAPFVPSEQRFAVFRFAAAMSGTASEAKIKVDKHSLLAFVPHTLALSAKTVSNAPLRAALSKAATGTGPLAAKSSDRPMLVAALTAIAERRGGKSVRGLWLRELPSGCCVCSRMFSKDEREALRGTVAERILADHERLAGELRVVGAALGEPFTSREITWEEADWSICVVLHHGISGADPSVSPRFGGDGSGGSLLLAPGLLDGVQRHWNDAMCSGLAKNVAPTGRLPGSALVAPKDMLAGDPVWLCAGHASNAHLLAMYGVAFPDNPNGAVMLQGGVPDDRLMAVESATERAKCSHEDSTTLALMHDAPAVLTDENVKCSSLVWMQSVGDALEAIEAAYFATWPRREAAADDRWLVAEANFYKGLGAGCSRSLEVLRESSDDASFLVRLREAASGGRELSRLALLVRQRDIELHEACVHWASNRSDVLSEQVGAEVSSNRAQRPHWMWSSNSGGTADSWPPLHEEL
eukprot:TRINITY_DN48940_c0_g1_i1.p1 TRINITY_DN48940_c0_g1~~TRINITY_DN48940_c0_g1_i1.p1  ORF type:complete len:548 (+),score=91.27 TRINITY_DN48940_c0_g1_i1:283-1926(+)